MKSFVFGLKIKRTVVMITNDVDEAALMADRIVPLTPGPNAALNVTLW